MNKQRYFLLLILLLSFIHLRSASSIARAAENPPLQYGGEMVLPVNEIPIHIDPLFASTPLERFISSQIYEGLLRFKCNGEPEPVLAESWELADNSKEIIFKLRNGIQFQDGTPLTSRTVVLSLERLGNPALKAPQQWILEPVAGYPEYKSGKAAGISGLQTPDIHTLKITLSTTAPDFLKHLSLISAAVTSVSTSKNALYGTGPFELDAKAAAGTTVLIPNLLYHSGRPCLDSVKMIPMPLDEDRLLEFERGNLTATTIPETEFRRLAKDPRHKDAILKTAFSRLSYLGCNITRKPMNDARFRQALSMAINRDDMLLMILNGHGKPMRQFIPFMEGNEPFFTYSPDSARLFCPPRLSKPVKLLIPANINTIQNLAMKITWNAQQAGIPMEVEAVPVDQYYKAIRSGDFDIYYGTYPLNIPGPEVYLYELLAEPARGGIGNATCFYNTEFMTLLNHYRYSPSESDRNADISRINKLLSNQLPVIPLFTYNEYWVYQDYLRNPGNISDPAADLRDYWIEKPETH